MFDWSWDNFKPTKDILQNMVYEESLVYNPDTKENKDEGSKNRKEAKDSVYGSKYKFYKWWLFYVWI